VPDKSKLTVGWPADVPIHRLELQPTDRRLFTERMACESPAPRTGAPPFIHWAGGRCDRHSTVPWHGRGDRRTMFFTYVRRDMKWNKGGLYDDADAALTPAQRDILSSRSSFVNEG
jgi:hypothetical protein